MHRDNSANNHELAIELVFTSITEDTVIQQKERLLASRGLNARTFPLSTCLVSPAARPQFSQQLIDTIQILHLTEIEHYFLSSPETPLSAVITPRTEMNSLIYIFKQLRAIANNLNGLTKQSQPELLQSAFNTLASYCDAFISCVQVCQGKFSLLVTNARILLVNSKRTSTA